MNKGCCFPRKNENFVIIDERIISHDKSIEKNNNSKKLSVDDKYLIKRSRNINNMRHMKPEDDIPLTISSFISFNINILRNNVSRTLPKNNISEITKFDIISQSYYENKSINDDDIRKAGLLEIEVFIFINLRRLKGKC